MTEQEEAERRHCEEVVPAPICGCPKCVDAYTKQVDLLVRERADARRRALEEAAQSVECWSSNTTTWNNAVAKRIRALASPKP